MVRVLYMSDLHLEMEAWRMTRPDWAALVTRRQSIARHPSRGPLLDAIGKVDLVVLAGDIHNGLRSVVYADQVARYLEVPVVLVAGNHEYYHHDMADLLPAYRRAVAHTQNRVIFLNNDIAWVEINGESLKILGCTLWTDYALHGDAAAAMMQAQLVMNDHRFIRLNNLPLTPWDARAFHEASVAWLHETLRTTAPARTIIVTHHAPTASVLGERRGEIAPAYGSEIIGDFAHWRPDLWVHGHTHYWHDSFIDGIHLVSAPRGYEGDRYGGYQPGLVEI